MKIFNATSGSKDNKRQVPCKPHRLTSAIHELLRLVIKNPPVHNLPNTSKHKLNIGANQLFDGDSFSLICVDHLPSYT